MLETRVWGLLESCLKGLEGVQGVGDVLLQANA